MLSPVFNIKKYHSGLVTKYLLLHSPLGLTVRHLLPWLFDCVWHRVCHSANWKSGGSTYRADPSLSGGFTLTTVMRPVKPECQIIHLQ